MALNSSALIAGAFLISGCGESGSPRPAFGAKAIDCASNATLEELKNIAIQESIFFELIKLNSRKSFRWNDSLPAYANLHDDINRLEGRGNGQWNASCVATPSCNAALDQLNQLEEKYQSLLRAKYAAESANDESEDVLTYDYEGGKAEADRRRGELERIKQEISAFVRSEEWGVAGQKLLLELEKIEASIDDDWARSSKGIKYIITDIVTLDRNDDLHSVRCKATLYGEISGWNGAHDQIEYTVERTSDGKALVTLLGG